MSVKRVILTFWILFALFVNLTHIFAEDLRLEGVVYDSANPKESLAVLNGEFVKAGEKVGDYKVVKVEPQSALLIHATTGEERLLDVSAKSAQPKPEGAIDSSSPAANGPAPGTPVPGILKQLPGGELKNKLGQLLSAPGELVNQFWERKALQDLATLHNACVNYYNKKNAHPMNFQELIAANLLASSFSSGVKMKYRFYLIRPPDPAEFGIHADPLEPQSGMHYFFVGTDAVMREAKDKSANSLSPPADY